MYAKISNFGADMKSQSINSDYVYTLAQDAFLKGNTFGPAGRESRRLMVDKCSVQWTPECDNFKRDWYNDKWIDQSDGVITDSQGDLVRHAAKMRYCKPIWSTPSVQPVDPNTGGTSTYTVYGSENENWPLMYECSVDPSTIDNDTLMDKVLERPLENVQILSNICNTHKNNGSSLYGTKVGGFCAIMGI